MTPKYQKIIGRSGVGHIWYKIPRINYRITLCGIWKRELKPRRLEPTGQKCKRCLKWEAGQK